MIKDSAKELLERAVQWVDKRKFSNIRAKSTKYDDPATFYRKRDDLSITPDITATRLGKKFYFDIALKNNGRRKLASKWQLMEELAKRKGGVLYLLAPRGHKAFAERMVQKFNINAKVVQLA